MEPQKTEMAGDRLRDIGTFDRVKMILVDFLRGYPAWKYHGIFEYYFEQDIAKEIIQELTNDGIIKLWSLDIKGQKVLGYSLTGKGAQLASTFSVRQKVKDYGLIGLVLVSMTIVIGLAQYLLSYAQYPLF